MLGKIFTAIEAMFLKHQDKLGGDMKKEEIRQKNANNGDGDKKMKMEKMYKRLGRNKMVYMIADINLDEKYLKQFYSMTKVEILEEMKKITNPNFQDNNGFSYLHTACQTHCVDAIKILLDLGANPNITDKIGAQPILSAIGSKNENNPKILELMFQHGLNVDLPMRDKSLKEVIESFGNNEYNEIIKKYYKK